MGRCKPYTLQRPMLLSFISQLQGLTLTRRRSSLPSPRLQFSKPITCNMKSLPKSKRPICPSCSKPLSTCICSRIKTPSLDNKIHVTILQHSLETKHPLNSVKILKLGLQNVVIVTVCDVNFEAQFEILPLESGSLLGLCPEVGKEVESTLDVCRNACESSESDQNSEVDNGGTDPLYFDHLRQRIKRKLNSGDIMDCRVEKHDVHSSSDYSSRVRRGKERSDYHPLLTISIKKYGEISSLVFPWMKKTESNTTKLTEFTNSPESHEAVAKGFKVKKLQKPPESACSEFEIAIPPGSALLFPSEDSVAIEEVDFEVKNLIVLDGTWHKANRIYNENPWLKLLPCLRLDIDKMSLFSDVRRQPKPGYLSTLESIIYALEALGEKDNHHGLDNMLDVFESMVGDQRRFKEDSIRKESMDC